jgi:hypothetical protein
MKEICMYCQHASYHPHRHHTFPCLFWTEQARIIVLDENEKIIKTENAYGEFVNLPVMVGFSCNCKEFTLHSDFKEKT